MGTCLIKSSRFTEYDATYQPSFQPERAHIQVQELPGEVNRLRLDGFMHVYHHNQNIVDSEKECIICLEEYIDGTILHMLPCNHIYHKHCLESWTYKNATCPKCRIDVTKH